MEKIPEMMEGVQPRMVIAHVSTLMPLRCGIASFVSDLVSATPSFDHLMCRLHYGGKPQFKGLYHADVSSARELAELARSISTSECDLVSLQHEFGIWGGREGENIHAFLDNLSRPLVSVLHTTFVQSRVQAEAILRLAEQSVRVIVLTEASKAALESLYGGSIKHIIVVPHGVPDVPYVAPPEWRFENEERSGPIRLITPGFFRPDKGLEQVLYAVKKLGEHGRVISYRIVGEPQQQFPDQESYYARIRRLIGSLNLDDFVQIDRRYLSVEEQMRSIQECHLGVFPYQVPAWASSGTIPLVMCAGRPVLCTPFEYAKVKEAEGAGVFLTEGFGSDAIAAGVEAFIRTENYASLTKAVYRRTRDWTWPTIGKAVTDVYLSCHSVDEKLP